MSRQLIFWNRCKSGVARQVLRVLGVTSAAVLFTACATELSATNEEGVPGFDSAVLRDARSDVITAANARYAMEAVCSGKKVAPRDSRRADFYERCEFAGISMVHGEATLTSITYHFLSAQLVQLDASLAGSARTMAPLADSLDGILGTSEFVANAAEGSELPQAVYHWMQSPEVAKARLQTVTGADGEAFLLSLQHPKIADVIAELPAL